MAVFLVAGLFGANLWFDHQFAGEGGVLGGPVFLTPAVEVPGDALLVAGPVLGLEEASAVEDGSRAALDAPESTMAATLRGEGQPMGIFSSRGEPVLYVIKQGDTLSGIAAAFNISVSTVTAANPKVRATALRVGQEIKILPISGVTYEVQGGDTLESIADFFSVHPTKIQESNRSVDFGKLQVGTSLVIPGGKSGSSYASQAASLPDLRGYFVQPAQGFNWGRLHNYNAVDVANSCGTTVSAAAEGLVVDADATGWNGGYGGFVVIEHPNETETRYAHLGEVTAKVGDYVKQNDEVGKMGNTGNVHGPTGCHLHFEVEGARNPFAK